MRISVGAFELSTFQYKFRERVAIIYPLKHSKETDLRAKKAILRVRKRIASQHVTTLLLTFRNTYLEKDMNYEPPVTAETEHRLKPCPCSVRT